MAGELERLLVRIEADTAILRREMDRAEKSVAGFSASTGKNLGGMQKRFDGFAASITKSVARFGAAFIAFDLLKAGADAIKAGGEINDLARNANLGVEAFQSFAFQAEKVGVGLETLSAASKKFAINMSQLRGKYGEFNDFLKEHAPALRQDLLATKDQESAYDVLANALHDLSSEGDRTTVSAKAFGKAGGEAGELFLNGAAGISIFTARAGDMHSELSQTATDGLEKFNDGLREMGQELKGIFLEGAGTAIEALSQLYEKLTGAQEKMAAYKKSLAGVTGGYLGLGEAIGKSGAKMPGKYPSALAKSTEKDFSGADAVQRLAQQRSQSLGNIGDVARQEFGQELEGFRRMLADKKISEEQFAQARADLGDIMAEKVKENLGAETEDQRAYFQELRGLIETDFMGAFNDALETGKFKASEFFATLTKGFAEATVKALVLKPIMDSLFSSFGGGAAGGLGSALGSLFTPGRAAGGPGAKGQPYLVGEHGRELFVPNSSGRFMNAGATAGAMGGATTNNYIDARGADISVAQRIERALAMSERSKRDPVSAVSKQQRRFPSRAA